MGGQVGGGGRRRQAAAGGGRRGRPYLGSIRTYGPHGRAIFVNILFFIGSRPNFEVLCHLWSLASIWDLVSFGLLCHFGVLSHFGIFSGK